MKLFCHYCLPFFTNCYILGSESSHNPEALIIDPGAMQEEILNFIENRGLILRGVLITHNHLGHVRGLRTLKRIYDAEIFGVNKQILEFKTTMVKDRDLLRIGEFTVEVITIPGHSSDSAVYRVEQMLFTGDALLSGTMGSTASSYGAQVQVNALRSKVLSLQENCIVLPGHGPPSSLEAEKRFNYDIINFEQRKRAKATFTLDQLE